MSLFTINRSRLIVVATAVCAAIVTPALIAGPANASTLTASSASITSNTSSMTQAIAARTLANSMVVSKFKAAADATATAAAAAAALAKLSSSETVAPAALDKARAAVNVATAAVTKATSVLASARSSANDAALNVAKIVYSSPANLADIAQGIAFHQHMIVSLQNRIAAASVRLNDDPYFNQMQEQFSAQATFLLDSEKIALLALQSPDYIKTQAALLAARNALSNTKSTLKYVGISSYIPVTAS